MEDINERFFSPNIPWEEARIFEQVLRLATKSGIWRDEPLSCIEEWATIFKESIDFYESVFLVPSAFVDKVRESEQNIPRLKPPSS